MGLVDLCMPVFMYKLSNNTPLNQSRGRSFGSRLKAMEVSLLKAISKNLKF